jgi:hypothetical protein
VAVGGQANTNFKPKEAGCSKYFVCFDFYPGTTLQIRTNTRIYQSPERLAVVNVLYGFDICPGTTLQIRTKTYSSFLTQQVIPTQSGEFCDDILYNS